MDPGGACKRLIVLAALVVVALSTAPAAHAVVIRPNQLPAEAFVNVYIQARADCVSEGQPAPTIGLEVTIPEGVLFVRPLAKPGWDIDITRGRFPKPVRYNGERYTEGVRRISWAAEGDPLEPNLADEFVLNLRTPAESGFPLQFSVVERCPEIEINWSAQKVSETGGSLRLAPVVTLASRAPAANASSPVAPSPTEVPDGGSGFLTYIALLAGVSGLFLGGMALRRVESPNGRGTDEESRKTSRPRE